MPTKEVDRLGGGGRPLEGGPDQMRPISITPCSGVMRMYEAIPAGPSPTSVKKSGSSEPAIDSSDRRSSASSV
jgi:hypothetical protein